MVEEVRNGEGREKRGRVKTEKEGCDLGDFNFLPKTTSFWNVVKKVVKFCCKCSISLFFILAR